MTVSQCHRGVCCRDNRVWVTCFSAWSCRNEAGRRGLRMVVQTSQDLNFSFLQRSLVGEGSKFNRGGGRRAKGGAHGAVASAPTLPHAGPEDSQGILIAGNEKPGLWILAVHTTAGCDYLRQPRPYFPASHPATRGDLGEPDYVFTRLNIPDFIYLRIFVRRNEGTIHLTAKLIRI